MPLSQTRHPWQLPNVATLAELQVSVAGLPEKDRASLLSFILDTLAAPDYDVGNEELAQRAMELESGALVPISLEELKKGVFADLGRE